MHVMYSFLATNDLVLSSFCWSLFVCLVLGVFLVFPLLESMGPRHFTSNHDIFLHSTYHGQSY